MSFPDLELEKPRVRAQDRLLPGSDPRLALALG